MQSILAIAVVSLFFASCASTKKTETTTTTTTATKAETQPVTPTKEKPSAKKTGVKKTETTTTESAAASSSAAGGEVTCKAGTDERKLAVTPKEQGCELQYTKAGNTSTIASQIIGNEKCETVQTNVKEKLIAAGFSCE